jgi:hypothetical protein
MDTIIPSSIYLISWNLCSLPASAGVHYQFVPRHVHLQGLRQPFPELREHALDTGQMLLLYPKVRIFSLFFYHINF